MRARVDFGLRKPKIAKPSLWGALLPWIIILLLYIVESLGAKSLSGSLGAAESHKRFVWQVAILEWSEVEKSF